jgi:hypothetical protein
MTVQEMDGWTLATLRGPRLVEMRHVGEDKVVWSTYVPDLSAAYWLWQEIGAGDQRLYDMMIVTQSSTRRLPLTRWAISDRKRKVLETHGVG